MPIFNLEPDLQGRCSLIRHLSLQFPGDDVAVRAASFAYRRDKKQEKGSWSTFIHQSRYAHDSAAICFTALKSLQLDFRQWHLGSSLTQNKLSVSAPNVFAHYASHLSASWMIP